MLNPDMSVTPKNPLIELLCNCVDCGQLNPYVQPLTYFTGKETNYARDYITLWAIQRWTLRVDSRGRADG